MDRLRDQLAGTTRDGLSLSLQGGSASPLDVYLSLYQAGEEGINLLLHLGLCSQASVCGYFGTHSIPDRLVGVEVWAVGRQRHKAQV